MPESDYPSTLIGWYITGPLAFLILTFSMATTYWAEDGDGTHLNAFEVCKAGTGCIYYDTRTYEGYLTVLADIFYVVNQIVVTIFVVRRRHTITSTKSLIINIVLAFLPVFLTLLACVIFVGEMNGGSFLSSYSYGFSFYLALVSSAVGLVAGILMYVTIRHYANINNQDRTALLSGSQVAPVIGGQPTAPVMHDNRPYPATGYQATDHSSYSIPYDPWVTEGTAPSQYQGKLP